MTELIKVKKDELLIDETFNHRGRVVPIDVIDLAADIKQNGLDTPITVQRFTDPNNPKIKYRVVAGHRRATAVFKNLDLPDISAYLRIFETEIQARTASLRENLHRKDLNIKQEAHGLKCYLDQHWPVDMIAKTLNQSRGWVDIRVKLLNLCPRVQDYAASGLINQEHIKFLQGKSEVDQLKFVHEVKEHNDKGTALVVEKPMKKVNSHSKVHRKREQIFELITQLYEIGLPMGLWSRSLSWAAGEISTFDLYKDVKEELKNVGIEWEIPEDVLLERLAT